LVILVCPLVTQADVLEDVLNRGKLKVGVALFTPWAMKDASGKMIGFEIDVANKLAKEMGVELEHKVYGWTDIIAALNNGEIDVIIAGMGITPKRALQMIFSLPYAESGVALATNTELTAGIKDLKELNQPRIVVAAVAKTLGSDVAKLVFDNADLRIMATRAEAEKAMLDGKAHAYVAGSFETTFLSLQNPDKIDMPLSKPLLVSVAGMGVKKGEQEMLNFLNAWITARAADTWLSATQKYWFKSLKWRDQVAQ
jgi:polar amino acid transport system substrate-binding protein